MICYVRDSPDRVCTRRELQCAMVVCVILNCIATHYIDLLTLQRQQESCYAIRATPRAATRDLIILRRLIT